MIKNVFKKTAVFSLLLVLLNGCISQRDADCDGFLRLEFNYVGNTRLSDNLRDMQVYVFDSRTGVLAHVIPVTQASINSGYLNIRLPQGGEYTLVAWGASSADMMQGGHKVVDMRNASAQEYAVGVQTGTTTLNSFRKMVRYTELGVGMLFRSGNGQGEITPYDVQFDHLFHAAAQEIPITAGWQTVPLDFWRNTSTLQIEIIGTEHLTEIDAPLHTFVTSNSASHYFDNEICTHARRVRYAPPYRAITDNEKHIDIKVHRLVIDRHRNTTEPVLLHLHHPVTGAELMEPLDVMEAILAVQDNTGAPVWATQEDIDRELEFPIRISFDTQLNVLITINDWVVRDLTPVLR